jgi:hypothetical protein
MVPEAGIEPVRGVRDCPRGIFRPSDYSENRKMVAAPGPTIPPGFIGGRYL